MVTQNPTGMFRKLALTRTPDPIRPTRRGPGLNRPTYGSKEEGLYDLGGFGRGFGRSAALAGTLGLVDPAWRRH